MTRPRLFKLRRQRKARPAPVSVVQALRQDSSKNLQRPKSLAPTKLDKERRSHGHNSINHPNPPTNRRASGVAVQFRLGILAQRRTGIDSPNSNNPRFDGTLLDSHDLFGENWQDLTTVKHVYWHC